MNFNSKLVKLGWLGWWEKSIAKIRLIGSRRIFDYRLF